jgi:hypothetical protein
MWGSEDKTFVVIGACCTQPLNKKAHGVNRFSPANDSLL